MVRLWLQDFVKPSTEHATRPGCWIAEPSWPAPAIGIRYLDLDASGRLLDGSGTGTVTVSTPLTVATLTGEWNPYGIGPELPLDQRSEDTRPALFDGPVLHDDLAIVGVPRLRVRLSADKPVATLVARPESVDPDGVSALITWGCLNLTHRAGHETRQALDPGVADDAEVSLNAIAQVVPAGHHLRLALATGSWPLLWPAPECASLTVDCGASALDLPVREKGELDATLPAFEGPEIRQPTDVTWLRPFGRSRSVVTDLASGRTDFVLDKDDGAYRIESHGMTVDQLGRECQSIVEGDPLSNRGEVGWCLVQERDDWKIMVGAVTIVTCDAVSFHVETRIVQTFQRAIPRDLM